MSLAPTEVASNNTTDHAAETFQPLLALLVQKAALPSSSWTFLAALLVAYCIYEQISFASYRRRQGWKSVPGPKYAVPLVGGLVSMVLNPYRFWEKQRRFAFPGFSWNSLLGKFMIFTTDPEISRRVFSFNDPETLLMAVHPSGRNILGDSNLAFMHGPPHKAIRKSFLSLFTRKALATYVEVQDSVIRRHLDEWLKMDGEREIRDLVRDLNADTSQEVFAGPYLTDPDERAEFSARFQDMTQGFLAFPLCLPGTAVWKGKKGRQWIVRLLSKAAAKSKDAMKAGGESRCLMDFWAQRCLEEIAEASQQGVPPPGHVTDAAMAETVMDFLFASQDASTASLVWVTCLMAEHPEVLAKVREEQSRLRPDPTATITGEVLAQMEYTRQVVKEVLRYRPPAPMVPQVVQKPFRLTEDYVAPKGALIMPSIVAANMQGFVNPEKFDPDRFGPARKEDIKYQKNYMTFGWGPHYCVGKEYAVNHLICYLAVLSTRCDWTRRRVKSDESDWLYLPTIYPADSFITLHPKAA